MPTKTNQLNRANKLVRVSKRTHKKLKINSARRGLSIGAYITLLASA